MGASGRELEHEIERYSTVPPDPDRPPKFTPEPRPKRIPEPRPRLKPKPEQPLVPALKAKAPQRSVTPTGHAVGPTKRPPATPPAGKPKAKKSGGGIGDKLVNWVLIGLVAAGVLGWLALHEQKPWDHRCRDGWVTHSDGPGTCSWHGGEDR